MGESARKRNCVAPEIPKPKTVEEVKEEEEEKPKEEEKKDAASLATVEKKARFNPLAAVYSNIDSEEPPHSSFCRTFPRCTRWTWISSVSPPSTLL